MTIEIAHERALPIIVACLVMNKKPLTEIDTVMCFRSS